MSTSFDAASFSLIRRCMRSEKGSNVSRLRLRISTNHCQNGLAFLPNSVLTGANTSTISYKKTTPGHFWSIRRPSSDQADALLNRLLPCESVSFAAMRPASRQVKRIARRRRSCL